MDSSSSASSTPKSDSKEITHKPKPKKSRTGCTTCKIRHVKCDETKSECRRCSTTGRVCDGYNSKIIVHHQCTSTPLPLLTLNALRYSRTTRSLEYFIQNALPELIGFNHKSEFWSQSLLQYSEASPAVLHSILALSALHQYQFQDNLTPIPLASKKDHNFLEQYNKSIRHLRSQKYSKENHQFTLSCCIIFICLENLASNYETAIMHLKNGLTVLQSWFRIETHNPSEISARKQIAHVFRRLDMQATAFLNIRQPQLISFPLPPQDHVFPAKFSSLQEAQEMLETIEVHMFYALTAKIAAADLSVWSDKHPYFPIRQKCLLEEEAPLFTKWKSAFDALCLTSSSNMKTEELQQSLIQALHYKCSYLVLVQNASSPISGLARDIKQNPQFEEIINLAESLIKNIGRRKYTFSADMGVIAPLYFTAVTAESMVLRRRAIGLLRGVHGKEGFWHPETAAGIAERVLMVKEEAWGGGMVG